LRGTLPEGDYSYLEGRCLHYGGSMPYLPILDVLKKFFDIEEEDREDTIKEKLRERLHDLDDRTEVVPPALHEVLSLKVEDEKYAQLGPQQRRERTFEAIRHLLIRESQKRPLILAIEDLHWIDKTSEEFLDYLIGFLPTTSILLILLYRPEYTHTWGSKSYYSKIGLDQLSAQTSTELVQAILEGGDVAPEIAGLVLGRAGGNPLFVEELTHSLVENGSIQRKNDRFVLARKPSEIEVPDTIQGIIAARMDRIEDNLKRIMQVASVIGREFAYRILQAITGMSEDLKSSLLNLQGLEFIYEKQLFPELEYIFKHALTQEVAYNSLLLKRRKEIHEKIGQAIEELYTNRLEEYYELLAYHYVRSDNEEKAVEYLDLANQKTSKANAMEEAKAYFEQAMRLLDILPDDRRNRERRVSLLVNQMEVFLFLMESAHYKGLLMRYESLAEEMENPKLLGSFRAQMSVCEYVPGNLDQSIQHATDALEICKTTVNAQFAGVAYTVLIASLYQRGHLERAASMKEAFLHDMGTHFDLRYYATALTHASFALSWLGRWEEAAADCEKVFDAGLKSSNNAIMCYGAWGLSQAWAMKGDLDRAIKSAELMVDAATLPMERADAQLVYGYLLCKAGEPDKGTNLMAPMLQLFEVARYVVHEWHFGAFLGDGYLLAGRYEAARQTAEKVIQSASVGGARPWIGFSQRILGEVALKTDPTKAAPHFEKAISIFQEIKAENELALAYSGMGRFHKQEGNTDQARKYLTDALEIFERLGTLIEPDKVREELAELPATA